MMTLLEGEKRDVIVQVSRRLGSGPIELTDPQIRVLKSDRSIAVDWAAATWDPASGWLYGLFDSTVEALADPGRYFVNLRGTVDDEVYITEVVIVVKEVKLGSGA